MNNNGSFDETVAAVQPHARANSNATKFIFGRRSLFRFRNTCKHAVEHGAAKTARRGAADFKRMIPLAGRERRL